MQRRFLSFVYAIVCALLAASARPHASAPDIVLYASDAVNLKGNWSRATDATAANGQTLVSVDQGWSTPNAPLAVPADAFEFIFNAPAGTPYHVWLRLHAAANSKFNDSVFVQFSDTVDPQGAALYPHRDDLRPFRQPPELQWLRAFGLGMDRRSLLAVTAAQRLVRPQRHAYLAHPDAGGRHPV